VQAKVCAAAPTAPKLCLRAFWPPFDICLPGKSLMFTGSVMTANFGAMNRTVANVR
jgi:hypothetical protein